MIGIYREVPGTRIPGGSEDVLLDLAVRQLVKNYNKKISNWLSVAENLTLRENSDLVNVCRLEKVLTMPVKNYKNKTKELERPKGFLKL